MVAISSSTANNTDYVGDNNARDDFHEFKLEAKLLVDDENNETTTITTANNSTSTTAGSACSSDGAITTTTNGADTTTTGNVNSTTASDSTNSNSVDNNDSMNRRYVTPKDFELLKVIGMGSFGKVLQVRNRNNSDDRGSTNHEIFAMKVISKRLLQKSKNGLYIENIQAERTILTKVVGHPFIITMYCSFQTVDKLFIIMDFCPGGELFWKLGKEGIFSERQTAFYAAEIVLAIDHLHSMKILHRDLKPENILLHADGHICITDFGLAKDFSTSSSSSTITTIDHDNSINSVTDDLKTLTICGTHEYMSPEMLAQQGYGRASDYWSLGCISYEMLAGQPPFESKLGSKDLFRKIMSERVKMPAGVTSHACKLLKGLLNRTVTQRLGTVKSTLFDVGGVTHLKQHAFFQANGIADWEKLYQKQIKPPVFQTTTTSTTGNNNDPTTITNNNDDNLQNNFHADFLNMPLPRSVLQMSHGGGANSNHRNTQRRVVSDKFRGFSFIADDFIIPDRHHDEINEYWHGPTLTDCMSESDVASSKQYNCHDNDDDNNDTTTPANNSNNKNQLTTTHNEEQQKKRPPRKRNNKKKPAAAAVGATPPAAGTSTARNAASVATTTSSVSSDHNQNNNIVEDKEHEITEKMACTTIATIPTTHETILSDGIQNDNDSKTDMRQPQQQSTPSSNDMTNNNSNNINNSISQSKQQQQRNITIPLTKSPQKQKQPQKFVPPPPPQPIFSPPKSLQQQQKHVQSKWQAVGSIATPTTSGAILSTTPKNTTNHKLQQQQQTIYTNQKSAMSGTRCLPTPVTSSVGTGGTVVRPNWATATTKPISLSSSSTPVNKSVSASLGTNSAGVSTSSVGKPGWGATVPSSQQPQSTKLQPPQQWPKVTAHARDATTALSSLMKPSQQQQQKQHAQQQQTLLPKASSDWRNHTMSPHDSPDDRLVLNLATLQQQQKGGAVTTDWPSLNGLVPPIQADITNGTVPNNPTTSSPKIATSSIPIQPKQQSIAPSSTLKGAWASRIKK